MKHLIVPTKGMGYTDLFLDFLSGNNAAPGFFAVGSIEEAAAGLDCREHNRSGIVDILLRQNRKYGASDAILAAIEKLRDPKALAVFSGQQAGLFGGPFLVVNKALAIVKAAERYSRQLNRPVVPIFWIAGDDHDFEEANHTYLFDRNVEPVRLEYDCPPEVELPTSEIRFSDEQCLNDIKTRLADTLGQTDFTSELYQSIDRCYTSDDSMVMSFGKLMTTLLGEHAPAFFSPGDPEAKKLAVPLFEAIVNRQDELHRCLNERNQTILDSGYHIQVEKKESSSHLFCNDNGRKPILRDGDGFLLGDKRFSRDELLARIRTEPERFSPDVLTRPLLQSYLFPVLSQKGGPSEIAYLAQINPLFELFDLATPLHIARASATIVEKRNWDLMQLEHIEFSELTGDIEQVINRVMSHSFPASLEKEFGQLRSDVEYHFHKFADESLKFDPSLKRTSEQIHGRIDFALKSYESKVFAAHKKKSQQVRDRIYKLHRALYPNRGLQERCLNICYFISRYGMKFVSFLYRNLDSEEKCHQLVELSDYDA